MADENQLSEDEVSRRIVAGMSLVHHLYNESYTLFRLIMQGLDASDADVGSFGGKGFILPKARKGTVVADRFLKTDMGFIAEIGAVGPDEPDDLGEDEEDIDDGDGENDKAQVDVTPDSQFLGVRGIFFDPSAGADFTPCVVAAVFSKLIRTSNVKASKQQQEQQKKFASSPESVGGLWAEY